MRPKTEPTSYGRLRFFDSAITLKAKTVDGLELLQGDLETLRERINRDAEIYLVGLEIFDEIHDEEAEKISDPLRF